MFLRQRYRSDLEFDVLGWLFEDHEPMQLKEGMLGLLEKIGYSGWRKSGRRSPRDPTFQSGKFSAKVSEKLRR